MNIVSLLFFLCGQNLRELSMYCLKHFPHESPMRVHAVASKYVCTQLQVSHSQNTVLQQKNSLIEHSFQNTRQILNDKEILCSF